MHIINELIIKNQTLTIFKEPLYFLYFLISDIWSGTILLFFNVTPLYFPTFRLLFSPSPCLGSVWISFINLSKAVVCPLSKLWDESLRSLRPNYLMLIVIDLLSFDLLLTLNVAEVSEKIGELSKIYYFTNDLLAFLTSTIPISNWSYHCLWDYIWIFISLTNFWKSSIIPYFFLTSSSPILILFSNSSINLKSSLFDGLDTNKDSISKYLFFHSEIWDKLEIFIDWNAYWSFNYYDWVNGS